MQRRRSFLNALLNWLKEVQLVKDEGCSIGYSEAFKSNSDFTEFISKVVDRVAEEQGLKHWREYYTLDHVLYKEEDRIPEGVLPFESSCVHGTWLKYIRIAFEHENSLGPGGGYQEFSKLMLFNADIKVLMGWANVGNDGYDPYAKDYWYLYESMLSETESKPILFIGEYSDSDEGHVDAYLMTRDGLLKWHSSGVKYWNDGKWLKLNPETIALPKHST